MLIVDIVEGVSLLVWRIQTKRRKPRLPLNGSSKGSISTSKQTARASTTPSKWVWKIGRVLEHLSVCLGANAVLDPFCPKDRKYNFFEFWCPGYTKTQISRQNHARQNQMRKLLVISLSGKFWRCLVQSGQLPSSFLQTFVPGSQTEPATFSSGSVWHDFVWLSGLGVASP